MSNSYAVNSSNFEVINTNGNVYTQSPELEGTANSVNADVENFDLTGNVSSVEANDANAGTITLSNGQTYDLTGLEPEDIEALVGSMSKEEYAEFIEGIRKYYQTEKDNLQSILDGSNGNPGVTAMYDSIDINAFGWSPTYYHDGVMSQWDDYYACTDKNGVRMYLDDYIGINPEDLLKKSYEEQVECVENVHMFEYYFGFSFEEYKQRKANGESDSDIFAGIDISDKQLDVEQVICFEYSREELLYDMKRFHDDELLWDEQAVEMYGESLGVKNVAELYATWQQLRISKTEIHDAISMLNNKITTIDYDYLYYLEDYQNYEFKTEFTEEEVNEYKMYAESQGYYTFSDYASMHPELTETEVMFLHLQAYDGYVGDVGYNSDLMDLYRVYKTHPQFLKTYSYLQKTAPDSVDSYVENIQYQMNQVLGQYEAKAFLDNLGYGGTEDEYTFLEKIANELQVDVQGLIDGLGSFISGVGYTVEAIWTFLFGDDEDENRSYSVDEYKKMYILQALLSEEDKKEMGLIVLDPETGKYVNADPTSAIDYTRNYTSFGSGMSSNYEIGQGIGNMLPSIALSAVNPIAGSVALGVSAGGNSYHSAMVEGHSLLSSIAYGLFNGTTEAVTEKLFGGLPLLGNVKVTGVGSYLASMGWEAFQEGFQEIMDIAYRTHFMGEEYDIDQILKNVKKASIYGGITAGILNVPSLASAMDARIAARKANINANQNGSNTTTNQNSASQTEVNNSSVDTNTNETITIARTKLQSQGIGKLTVKEVNALMQTGELSKSNLDIKSAYAQEFLQTHPDLTIEQIQQIDVDYAAQRANESITQDLNNNVTLSQEKVEKIKTAFADGKGTIKLSEDITLEDIKSYFAGLSSAEKYTLAEQTGWITHESWGYGLITAENAGNFITLDVVGGNVVVNLTWPEAGGYDITTIKSVSELPDMVEISRIGGKGGTAFGIGKMDGHGNITLGKAVYDLDGNFKEFVYPENSSYATASQRSIPKSGSQTVGRTEVFNVKAYKTAVDIVTGSGTNVEKINSLVNSLNIDEVAAENLITSYDRQLSNPEVSGDNSISNVLDFSGRSVDGKYGYYGAADTVFGLDGGAGQLNTVFNEQSMIDSGIITVTDENFQFN